MWSLVGKRWGTTSWDHSLAISVKTQARQTFSRRPNQWLVTPYGSCCGFSPRPEQEQKVWVPAKCPSCPSSFTAVSPKQRAPNTVHRTWLGLLHAAHARAGVGRQGPVRAGRAQKPRAGEEPRQQRRGLWHGEEKAPQGQGLTLDSKLEPSF